MFVNRLTLISISIHILIAEGLLREAENENNTWIKEYKKAYIEMIRISKCVVVRNARASSQFSSETLMYLMHLNIPTIVKTHHFDDGKCKSFLITFDNYKNAKNELKISEMKKSMYSIIVILIESKNNLTKELTLTDVEDNFKLFGFACVLLLSHDQIYKLSSKLSLTRHFEPKNRTKFIGNWKFRGEPTKLPNFQRRQLRVVTFDCPIYVLIRSRHNSTVNILGLEQYLFNEFSRYLNFTWTVNDITDDAGRFGQKCPNGSWTGAIGELMNGRADVFFCGLWIDYFRAEVIEFTAPLLQQEIAFFVPMEQGLQWSSISILLPFTVTVWVITCSVFFLLTFTLFMAAHMSKYCPSLQRIAFLPRYRRYSTCLIHVFGIITTCSPPSRKRRSLLLVIMQIYAFLLIASYNSKIRDEIMTPKNIIINDIQELVELKYDWAEPKSSNSQVLFNVNNNWHMKFLNRSRVVKPIDIERILKEERTAISGKTITRNVYKLGYKLQHETLGKLKKVNEVTACFNMAFGLVKNSRYLESFNRIILRATDSGLIDFLSHRAAEVLIKEELLFLSFGKYKLTNYIQLSIEHIQGVLLAFMIGIAISSIVFLYEILLSKRLSHDNNK